VIATPGRLIDHLKNTPTFTLDSIEVLVLDEADRYSLFFRLFTITELCFSMWHMFAGGISYWSERKKNLCHNESIYCCCSL